MGEIVTCLPINGSFITFANRFVSPSFGFGLGWLYTYNNAVIVAAEVTAVAGMINFWNDTINNAVWCAIVIVSFLVLNVAAVKWFGEGEFWFSINKIILIIGLLFFTRECRGNGTS
jgi:amino acid transporter